MKNYYFIFTFIFLFFGGTSSGQIVDSAVVVLKNQISNELALKISGTKFAIANSTNEEVDQAINQKMYSDLFALFGRYLEENLKLRGFAFTETQKHQLTSKKEISVCDLVYVELNPGKFYRTIGALGVYRKAFIEFRFCDQSIYKIMLSEISVDGYSYHPNRFAAAFKRIKKPDIIYIEANRLSLKKLPILIPRVEIDSLLDNRRNSFEGEYQGLGFDKASPSFSIAVVKINGKLYGLYTGGGNQLDWECGEVKVELTPTKSDKVFIGNWYNRNKIRIDNVSLIFENENILNIRFDGYEDKFVRVK